ncbi:helix-turn-helix domain-containing protein [Bhargavaea beijingensis]|uniref:helix-turn-helix domain-containing protein n=1 Tax=Bhargavaea beijingensis TaxID=426756 RepID=UPI0022249FC4|nr:helix-turn-helix transcriptional regulator [Bhargavaea beijingensis]MCW1926947.1 helix-turn-helix transcriptional regulator [Bhargavaea beijingensis]
MKNQDTNNEHQATPQRMVIVLKFREAIEKRGLSQRAVAEMTGLRPNAVNTLAQGRIKIERLSLDHVERIATALGIEDLTELIELVPESKCENLTKLAKIDEN